MNRRPAIASVLAAALALAACGQKPASDTAAPGADLIISGGPIVTMEGNQPTTVEAIVVDDGRIVFVGSKADALKQQGAGTVLKDLAGKTLMPGFIDGHAHAQQFGTQAVGANLLAPPDGSVNTIDDVVAKLKTFAEGPDVDKTGWIFGMGYDDALLGRHPTREDLDKVSTTVPVMATHISGHFAAVNSLGLKMIGYDATTPDPEGGVIRREADGRTLLPGFIDGHAHAQQFGMQAVGANLLAPPDGSVNTIDDVVAKLKTFAAGPDVNKTGWIFGVGYDDALLGRHPTREDLDKVSTTVPVMATHISAHFAAVNTLALKMIGYDASTPNPEGGVIRREADGKTPNGVLEELAAMPTSSSSVPRPSVPTCSPLPTAASTRSTMSSPS